CESVLMSSEKWMASTLGRACAATEVTKMRKPAAASKLKNRRARRIRQLWHGEGGCRARFPYTRSRAGPVRTRPDRVDPSSPRRLSAHRRGAGVRGGEAGRRTPHGP